MTDTGVDGSATSDGDDGDDSDEHRTASSSPVAMVGTFTGTEAASSGGRRRPVRAGSGSSGRRDAGGGGADGGGAGGGGSGGGGGGRGRGGGGGGSLGGRGSGGDSGGRRGGRRDVSDNGSGSGGGGDVGGEEDSPRRQVVPGDYVEVLNEESLVPVLSMVLNTLCAEHTAAATVANAAARARSEDAKDTARALSDAAIAASDVASTAALNAVTSPMPERLSIAANAAVASKRASDLAKAANARARAPVVLIPVDGSTLPTWEQRISVFFSVAIPAVDTTLYMRRLVKYCRLSPTVVIVALVLLHRAREADGRLAVSGWNVHRLMLTALMVSCKSVEERTYGTAHFARVGGVGSVAELVRLEGVFLKLLNWRVQVNGKVLGVAEERLLERYHECIERGLSGTAAAAAVVAAREERATRSTADAADGVDAARQ